MNGNEEVFGEAWRACAVAGGLGDSWVNEVVAPLESDGRQYLATLAKWFMQCPIASLADRSALRTRLESFTTSDHLGAVNELCWYQFMRQSGFQVDPIPTAATARPDFMLSGPASLLAEVSTLNVSQAEKTLRVTGGVDLNHRETVRRLLRKASDDKHPQFEYAASKGMPCLLALFDYTFWSALATDLCRFLAAELLGDKPAFAELPGALSAVVYVERRVASGRIVVSRLRSAVYHNPEARYPLDASAFHMLRQFRHGIKESAPDAEGDWIEL